MKKWLTLLTLLLIPIITGCVTTKVDEVYLTPRPERGEQPHCTSVKDIGFLINYYEGLLQEWELWGNDTVEALNNSAVKIIEIDKD